MNLYLPQELHFPKNDFNVHLPKNYEGCYGCNWGKRALSLEGSIYEYQMQYPPLSCPWLVAYPVPLTMWIIRDTGIKSDASDASSALHLEFSSCGNAHGGIKRLEKVH